MKNTKEVLDITCLYLSNMATNTNKFYIATIEKDNGAISVVFKYGRLGNKKPVSRPYPCTSLDQAQTKYWNKIREQENQGYLETDLEVIMQSDGSFME